MRTFDPLAHLGSTARMGTELRAEVERQLLTDLSHYGVSDGGLTIDWSDACQEGHCTEALDGNLEELSGVVVLDEHHETIAEGWMDFVHGGRDKPLHVFWLFLRVCRNGQWHKVKAEANLPDHVWSRMSPESRLACSEAAAYDSRWSKDPIVQAWARNRDA